MATVFDLGSMLWSWFKLIIKPEALTASSESVGPLASIDTQENVKTSLNFSHETPNKRQKISKSKPALSKSKSMTSLHCKEVYEILDISECDVDEARRKIDQFWEPRPLPWKKNSPRQDQKPSLRKSRSSSETNPENQIASQTFWDSPSLAERLVSNPRYLIADRKSKYMIDSYDHCHTADINSSIENLLVDSTKLLTISEFKKEKNILRAKERKEKERQDAINKARQRRLRRIYPKENLVQFLDSYWEERVSRAHSTCGEESLTTSIGGTELRIRDFKTLLDRKAWLNDEIINSYIEWIVHAANKAAQEEISSLGLKPSSTPRFIAHNSFFFETLRKRGPASLGRLMKRKGAPGLSLLEVDSVFVPICSGSHWTLGVIRPIAKTIEYFDSMGGNPSTFIFHMQNWLRHQLGEAYSPEDWKVPNTACAHQTNGYDCGVFVCTNAYCVAVGLDTFCYQESDMTRQRKNIAAVLLNRGFTGELAWKFREDGLMY